MINQGRNGYQLSKIYNSQQAHIPQKYIKNINFFFFLKQHTLKPTRLLLCVWKLKPYTLNRLLYLLPECSPLKGVLRSAQQTVSHFCQDPLFLCSLPPEAVSPSGKPCSLWSLVNPHIRGTLSSGQGGGVLVSE